MAAAAAAAHEGSSTSLAGSVSGFTMLSHTGWRSMREQKRLTESAELCLRPGNCTLDLPWRATHRT